jgi:hypothetical protein
MSNDTPSVLRGLSQADMRRQIEERLYQVELLKNEMKKELKRL